MSISKSTQYGNIEISIDAIASLAGGVVTECYGVVGMASQKFLKDGIAELLKKENYAKGVVVRQKEDHLELDLYIVTVHFQLSRQFNVIVQNQNCFVLFTKRFQLQGYCLHFFERSLFHA